jgi:glutamate-1-semialdehyde 2,1-aminomutase
MQAIRRICDEYGVVFIIDEILSGFRTGMTGGHGYYGVTPDLCLFGKALTNGVPLAAIAGKEKIMMKIMDPIDPVVAGGTFSGNLFGCAAGIEALTIMEQPGFFNSWLKRVDNFYAELQTSPPLCRDWAVRLASTSARVSLSRITITSPSGQFQNYAKPFS